jgi:hypothetical protein
VTGQSTSSIAPTASATESCAAPDGHCITCGDEGIEMRVLEATDAGAICTDERYERHDIAVDLVAPVRPGDSLLVHAGVAIRHLGAAA